MRLSELGALLGLPMSGGGDPDIRQVAPLATAGEGDLAFYSPGRGDPVAMARCAASALILPPGVEGGTTPRLIADNPLLAAARAQTRLCPEPRPTAGIHPSAVVHPSASVDPTATVGPFVCLDAQAVVGPRAVLRAGVRVGEGSRIGADTVLFDNVVLYQGVVVGERCRVHAGSVLGADGFGYVPDEKGNLFKIPQTGGVTVEDDVEIGALVTIDRATFTTTRIGAGTKIDDHCHVGHNVDLGRHVIMAGMSGVAGSTKIGDRVMIGGMSAISDNLEVASGVMIAGMTGVHKSLTEKGIYEGPRAMPRREFVAFMKAGENLAKLKKRVDALEHLQSPS
ncbi:MAG: UDP-3-O-(3-hydroxymyristoyl)glucosamine N-acyltransferase [Nitrospinae bacterium]|nr:UDP-3-O-(3-hydroxymyristoyl)glucosamine N-acyltransferase [Nitrospinota bacterium]